MRLSELLEMIEEVRQEIGPDLDPEIIIATQPRYPHAHDIGGVTLEQDDSSESPTSRLVILEGHWRGYASRNLWEER